MFLISLVKGELNLALGFYNKQTLDWFITLRIKLPNVILIWILLLTTFRLPSRRTIQKSTCAALEMGRPWSLTLYLEPRCVTC